MKVLVRKNRLVEKMFVNRRGQINTDQVKLPANALRVTGVHVTGMLLQAPPQGAVNRVYFGASSDVAPTPNMIGALPNQVLNSNTVDVNVTANAGQYLYYAHPVWLTDPVFNFGGFVGGFLDWDIEAITTPEGIFSYRVWRSTNANLGNTSIHIVH